MSNQIFFHLKAHWSLRRVFNTRTESRKRKRCSDSGVMPRVSREAALGTIQWLTSLSSRCCDLQSLLWWKCLLCSKSMIFPTIVIIRRDHDVPATSKRPVSRWDEKSPNRGVSHQGSRAVASFKKKVYITILSWLTPNLKDYAFSESHQGILRWIWRWYERMFVETSKLI